ncbi:hypothetical protein EYF80_067405 [Liparis tanakae]|uniref:Uncharacterized protein n=1 Tax=Liparis tanakae TaxID=230148 RepID=A0A4Z2E108_9TELE|nr:hypothetical protein EYF80_067405 [Liparis tanakae]
MPETVSTDVPGTWIENALHAAMYMVRQSDRLSEYKTLRKHIQQWHAEGLLDKASDAVVQARRLLHGLTVHEDRKARLQQVKEEEATPPNVPCKEAPLQRQPAPILCHRPQCKPLPSIPSYARTLPRTPTTHLRPKPYIQWPQ